MLKPLAVEGDHPFLVMGYSSIEIEPVQILPLQSLESLVAESEQAGLNSLRRLRADWLSGENRFDRPGEALFSAYRQGTLVGVCGLNRDPYAESDQIGRIRRLYVLQSERHRGIGQALVNRVEAQARAAAMTELRIRVGNPLSNAFFLNLGFAACPDEVTFTHRLLL